MATHATQFKKALGNIEPETDAKNAAEAHKQVTARPATVLSLCCSASLPPSRPAATISVWTCHVPRLRSAQ